MLAKFTLIKESKPDLSRYFLLIIYPNKSIIDSFFLQA